jgi:hypothetical protein
VAVQVDEVRTEGGGAGDPFERGIGEVAKLSVG